MARTRSALAESGSRHARGMGTKQLGEKVVPDNFQDGPSQRIQYLSHGEMRVRALLLILTIYICILRLICFTIRSRTYYNLMRTIPVNIV